MIGKSSSVRRSIFQYVFDEASNSFWCCWTHWTVLFHFWLEKAKNWSFIEKSEGTLGDLFRNANKETDRLKFRCTLSNFTTIRVIKLFITRKSVALYCKNESFANYQRTIQGFFSKDIAIYNLNPNGSWVRFAWVLFFDPFLSQNFSAENPVGNSGLDFGVFIKRFSNYRLRQLPNHFESAKVERNLRNHLNDIKRVEAPEVIIRLLLNVLTPEKIINFSVKAKASVGPFSGHYSRSTFWLWPSSRRAAA